jgi:hypothetical protein
MNKNSVTVRAIYYLSAAVIAISLLPQARSAPLDEASNYNEWDVRIGVPIWGTGMDGRVGARGRTAEVDEDFWDLFDNLAWYGALDIDVRYCSHWLFFANTLNTRLKADGEPRRSLIGLVDEVKVTQQFRLIEFGVGYNLFPRKKLQLEPFIGGRFFYLAGELELSTAGPNIEFSQHKSWIDPMIGFVFRYPTDSTFSLYTEADIGGLIAADVTWQVNAGVEWDMSKHFYLRATYRNLNTDFDDDGFVFDVNMGGPQLELGWHF